MGHYRDRDRHLGGGGDLGHVHEAIDEEAVGGEEASPAWSTTVTATATPEAVPTSATCMKPSTRKPSVARSRSLSGPAGLMTIH